MRSVLASCLCLSLLGCAAAVPAVDDVPPPPVEVRVEDDAPPRAALDAPELEEVEEDAPSPEETAGILGVLSASDDSALQGHGVFDAGGLGVGEALGVGGLGLRGSAAAGPPAPAPGGGPAVAPSLERSEVQRVVRQHTSALRGCYEQALQGNPSIAGTVKVRFVIAVDGTVSRVDVVEGIETTVDACVRDAFQAMTFPRPTGGVVVVNYPVVFASK